MSEINEVALTESRSLRTQYANRTDVLDKVKALQLLPSNSIATLDMVAAYYEVDHEVIKWHTRYHRDELQSDGFDVLTGERLSQLRAEIAGECDSLANPISPMTRSLAVFPRRAILRMGMLLEASLVALRVRDYLLNVEEQDRIAEGDELALLEDTNQRLARAIDIAKQERAARVEAEAEVAAMVPVVEEHEQITSARGLVSMAVFAQQSGIVRPGGKPLGERTAIEALRALHILKDAPGTDRHNTPYQEHAHRIVTKAERRGPVTVNVPYVAPSQVGYLMGRINDHFRPGHERLPRPRLGQLRAIEGGA